MNSEIFFRSVTAGVVSLVFVWVVYSRNVRDEEGKETESSGRRYLPYASGVLLPVFLLTLTLLDIHYHGAAGAVPNMLSLCFGLFLHISVYYALLLLLLPLFRERFSARACAMLWLIPNYLYIFNYKSMELPRPFWVITAPGKLVWALFFLWFSGFCAVMIYKTAEHLAFRHRVLARSVPVTDGTVLSAWQKTADDAGLQNAEFRLVVSPDIHTPLTVGLFRCRMAVVLPRKTYTADELELIFRHEIVHISREDAWSKYFMVFCTAMCWFNPLMWKAMGKSAADMELSCDETVLLSADGDTRNRYASLLLNTAGDGRGFTTCLSASAEAMRYRLNHIVKPVKRRSGAILVGAVFFFLCMTSGYVALAYGGRSGAEVIYQSRGLDRYELRSVSEVDDSYHTEYEIVDEKGFHEYLAGLTLYEITGNYSFSQSDREFFYLLETPEGTLGIELHDDAVKLVRLWGDGPNTFWYYIKEGVDWEYLDTAAVAYPALNLHLTKEGDPYGEHTSARLTRLYKTVDGEETLVYASEDPEEEANGIFGAEPFDEMSLSFSKAPAAPCTVRIQSWDRSESHTVTLEEDQEPVLRELPEEPTHYIFSAEFQGPDNELYEAEFRFDLGDLS